MIRMETFIAIWLVLVALSPIPIMLDAARNAATVRAAMQTFAPSQTVHIVEEPRHTILPCPRVYDYALLEAVKDMMVHSRCYLRA